MILRIRGIVLDIDGVLTDGTFWWGPDGAEWKRFSFADVMGIARSRRAGVVFALVSGEEGPIADRLARKLEIEDAYFNCKDKAAAVRDFAARHALDMPQVCFMGNDVNDLPAMAVVGLAAAPADAEPAVRAAAGFVSDRGGGRGAARDLIEHLFPETLRA